MDQTEFADGFDRPDTLAFGLGAGQLVVVMVGALAAYALARSPVPPAIADPVAGLLAVAAAALGWMRIGGRPALDWATFAALFWVRARRGTAQWVVMAADGEASDTGPHPAPSSRAEHAPDPGAAPGAAIIELFDTRATHPAGRPEASPQIRRMSRSDGARRVTFFSLRGGTGRSTLATELTCLLAATRSDDHPAPRVALVDLDLRSPSIAVRLGAPERTLLDYALAPPEERSVIDFMVGHASGARILLGPQRAVHPEWPVTPALLREALRELDMEGFDIVILDVCPELNPLTTTALCACDDVFIVIVPTAGGVQDAYRSTEALRRLGLRHQLRYIVNRSRPGTDLSEPMADLGGQIIGDIPDDEAVINAENAHRLIGLEESGPAAIALRRLARRVGGELRSAWPA
ncbi:MAG TPA: AAA family ATPase [Candidatus Saccharimonadales bacterium]|nr:AAA family ATPase [Candidatus Saccharimonadales bacterium]